MLQLGKPSNVLVLAVLLLWAPAIKIEASSSSKAKLAGNRKVTYTVWPKEAETVAEVFSEGVFHGRLRLNTFAYHWDAEIEGVQQDNYAQGLGGSLIYRSGVLNGFSFTTGVYTSHSPLLRMDQEAIGRLKSGKDVLSRSSVRDHDCYDLTVIGQAFVSYATPEISVIAGRQLYESLYTASNDTKMIPNTFDGISLRARITDKSTFRFAWLSQQKLRDHTHAHDVITYKDEFGDSWANQDDSAIHKGLSYEALVGAGESVEHDLWLMDYAISIVKDLKLTLSGYTIPGLLQGFAGELNYDGGVGDWKISPGLRVMQQLDNGAGAIGGAAISGKVNHSNPAGYLDPECLDSTLWALRVVVSPPVGGLQFLMGYSKVANKADFVAPWRSMPTGGYTRAMSQYNWRAGNGTAMFQIKIDFERLGWFDGFNTTLCYAMQDEDESKGYHDRNVAYLDFTQKLTGTLENVELKLRYGRVDDAGSSSYAEYRFETNILF